MYGTEPGRSRSRTTACWRAGSIERGVRFVQLYHRGWDTHGASVGTDIVVRVPRLCLEIDRAIGALLTDLKQRGLLDTTLVVWGGEFGRTPINEARNGSKLLGRDHHPRAFTMWMAGGGIKPGVTIGRTDDLGYNIVEDPVDVHDLHATMLHLHGHRPHETDVQVPGPGLPADGRLRQGGPETARVNRAVSRWRHVGQAFRPACERRLQG